MVVGTAFDPLTYWYCIGSTHALVTGTAFDPLTYWYCIGSTHVLVVYHNNHTVNRQEFELKFVEAIMAK